MRLGSPLATSTLASLAPRGVAVVETWTPSVWEAAPLFAEESAQLGPQVPVGRLREFRLGRACARRALASLNVPPAPILIGPNGAPVWPTGIVGSITHCSGYCAAAVAYADHVAALGIDAELNEGEARHWETLVFSARESVYKALSALTGGWLDFRNVEVTFQPEQHSFSSSRVMALRGYFARSASHIFTLATCDAR